MSEIDKEVETGQRMKEAMKGEDLMTSVTAWRDGHKVAMATFGPSRDHLLLVINGMRVCFSADTVSYMCEAYQEIGTREDMERRAEDRDMQYAMETGEDAEGITECLQIAAITKENGKVRAQWRIRCYTKDGEQVVWNTESDTDFDSSDEQAELYGPMIASFEKIFERDDLMIEKIKDAPAHLTKDMSVEQQLAHMDYVGQQHLGELMMSKQIVGSLMLFADPGSEREGVFVRSQGRDAEEDAKKFPSADENGMTKTRKMWRPNG